jgi:hypothetical protein
MRNGGARGRVLDDRDNSHARVERPSGELAVEHGGSEDECHPRRWLSIAQTGAYRYEEAEQKRTPVHIL